MQILLKQSMQNMQYFNFAKNNYCWWPYNKSFIVLMVKHCFMYGFLLLEKTQKKPKKKTLADFYRNKSQPVLVKLSVLLSQP